MIIGRPTLLVRFLFALVRAFWRGLCLLVVTGSPEPPLFDKYLSTPFPLRSLQMCTIFLGWIRVLICKPHLPSFFSESFHGQADAVSASVNLYDFYLYVLMQTHHVVRIAYVFVGEL